LPQDKFSNTGGASGAAEFVQLVFSIFDLFGPRIDGATPEQRCSAEFHAFHSHASTGSEPAPWACLGLFVQPISMFQFRQGSKVRYRDEAVATDQTGLSRGF